MDLVSSDDADVDAGTHFRKNMILSREFGDALALRVLDNHVRDQEQSMDTCSTRRRIRYTDDLVEVYCMT